MKWKQFVGDYLSFTRKERIAVLALVLLIVVVFLLPGMIRGRGESRIAPADTSWISAAKRLEVKQPGNRQGTEGQEQENNNSLQYDWPVSSGVKEGVVFYFDPNTLDEAGWRKLGLRKKTIRTIQNYLAKGGHFYKPEDLKKIYGLHPDEYVRLEPYIRIEASQVAEKLAEYDRKETETKSASNRTVDINTADTSAFIALPGIGSKLAARIVNFRDKLGGFWTIDQVKETYGLPDSTFQKIKPRLQLGTTPVKKININTATMDELKAHPYIKYNLAKPIVAYREEHGAFSKIEDIRKIMAITEESYQKMSPYLTL
ncbi:MAG: helix-hairpin-helix domain-containing protein [Chitinophagaceae bacterium]|nr:helix-hairpin-helix domain-containing protein [Chitinophagaceae bacterium]